MELYVWSQKNAEKHGHAKAYLARLKPGLRGSVAREFLPKTAGSEGNRRVFGAAVRPGEVFEARRWEWDGERYAGGTVWVGVQADGSLLPLTRDEAMLAATSPRIEGPAPALSTVVDYERAHRFAPRGLTLVVERPDVPVCDL